MKNILVLGGGAKENIIASILGQHHNVMRFEKDVTDDAIKICDTVVLPLPATDGEYITGSNIKAERITACKNKKIIGGRITKLFEKSVTESDVYDYTKLEEFAIRNAVPTAEAAISIAVENTPFTIHGSSCLITGYGRIAKVLARYLRAMGAKVTCVIRNISQTAQAEADGFDVIKYNDIEKFRFDIIFNTVPAMIFDERLLLHINPGLIIDLASMPGGCDFEVAGKLGIKTIHALSLPGRTAPLTAARIAADTISAIL